jgi:hypothetical protein
MDNLDTLDFDMIQTASPSGHRTMAASRGDLEALF